VKFAKDADLDFAAPPVPPRAEEPEPEPPANPTLAPELEEMPF
jgi:hypothetical protein